jgi:hypothetical protein
VEWLLTAGKYAGAVTVLVKFVQTIIPLVERLQHMDFHSLIKMGSGTTTDSSLRDALMFGYGENAEELDLEAWMKTVYRAEVEGDYKTLCDGIIASRTPSA